MRFWQDQSVDVQTLDFQHLSKDVRVKSIKQIWELQ